MSALYNEIEPFAVEWLRNLSAAGHVAPGVVDDRSISEISSPDVGGATQAHFFAGVGVWSHALRLAGWPDDAPVWTGSCPCQPFSVAGKRGGTDDERHLWPVFFRLIAECRPPVVFGEQVASADGRAWLETVRADLEGVGYAVGAADLCAAGVGAPHIRQRLYWVAYARDERREGLGVLLRPEAGGRDAGGVPEVAGGSGARGLADADVPGPQGRVALPERATERAARAGGVAGGVAHAHGIAGGQGSALDGGRNPGGDAQSRPGLGGGVLSGHWSDADWLPCRDGKWRPVEPGSFPLAHGAPGRVGRLRAYGNAINAQVAATFIRSAMESGVRP